MDATSIPFSVDTQERTQDQTLGYFIRVIVLTFGLQLPAVLGKFGVLPGGAPRYMGLFALGALAPVIAATWSAWKESGKPGVKALYARIKIRNFGVHWYAIALGLVTALSVLSHAVYLLLGKSNAGNWFYPPENSQQIMGLIMMPINEEIGWRGFALPRLERRFGVLKSSLILGVIWVFWHSAMFAVQGETLRTWTLESVYILVGSVWISWMFFHTKGSLLIAILAHMGVHLNSTFRVAQTNIIPALLTVIALILFVLAILLFDRKVWTSKPTFQLNRT